MLVGMAPRAYRYASKRPDDGEVRTRLRALASERRRFGYRRLHILLMRQGMRLKVEVAADHAATVEICGGTASIIAGVSSAMASVCM